MKNCILKEREACEKNLKFTISVCDTLNINI
jgi:hypothetical protein